MMCQGDSNLAGVLQVYDVVLDAALRAQKCGPRQLQVQDEWEWLLSEFSGRPSAHQAFALKAPAIPVLILQECSLLSQPYPLLMHVEYAATHQTDTLHCCFPC